MPLLHSPICIHPANRHLFSYHGASLVLSSAIEPGGAIINRAFNYPSYLNELSAYGQNVVRLKLMCRAPDGNSPLAPAPDQTIMPYRRTGTTPANDGQPKWDLHTWDNEYFLRLRDFVARAGERKMIVIVTLFTSLRTDREWYTHPLHADNHIQRVGSGLAAGQFTTLASPDMVRLQQAFVEKVFTELKDRTNVVYEVCDSPCAWAKVTPAEVHAWQQHILEQLAVLKRKLRTDHLVVCQGVYGYALPDPWSGTVETHAPYLQDPGIAALVLQHDLWLKQTRYPSWHTADSGVPELRALGEAALFMADKPLLLIDSRPAVDETDWVRQRKLAWAARCLGLHFIQSDSSYTTADARGLTAKKGIRSSLKIARDFFGPCDFGTCEFLPHQVVSSPLHTVGFLVNEKNRTYYGYFADTRPADTAAPPIEGSFTMTIADGAFQIIFYSPADGQPLSQPHNLHGGIVHLKVPAFKNDLAFKITRK